MSIWLKVVVLSILTTGCLTGCAGLIFIAKSDSYSWVAVIIGLIYVALMICFQIVGDKKGLFKKDKA